MITLQQVQKAIKGNSKIDQTIDFDGDYGFLLVLNDGWNWDAADPGCYTRSWDWDEGSIVDVKASIRGITSYYPPRTGETK